MHLHSSNLDLQKFHTEHVARSSLPSDDAYDGVCGKVKELHEQHTNDLLKMYEYFQHEEKTWYKK